MSSSPHKRLFTPGPLNCAPSVRKAMDRDLGSREPEFIDRIAEIRKHLLHIADLDTPGDWTCVLMQGSGTFAIESAITTLSPKDGKCLILNNGAYGARMLEIAQRAGLPSCEYTVAPTERHDPQELEKRLRADPMITTVALVHCETTTGMLNEVERLSEVIHSSGRRCLIDAMSSFGALELQARCDCIVASANKCLESVPGIGFVLVRKDWLKRSAGQSPSLSLDLYAQWQTFERSGQFRFTPPTHVLLAFEESLRLYLDQGGQAMRLARYQANHRALIAGMQQMGFKPVLPANEQSPIITAFHYPNNQSFCFDRFYNKLSQRGCIIYPGKLMELDCFRIGTIGQIDLKDIAHLLQSIQETCQEMSV